MTRALESPRSERWRSLGTALGGGVAGGAALTAAGTATNVSPWMLLALPFAAALGAALLLSPSLAFLLTAAVIPVERLGRLTDDSAMYTISLMRIVGTLALVAFLWQALVRRQRIVFGGAFWLYASYFVIAMLGLMHTSDQLGTVRALGALLGNLLFFWLVVNLGRDTRLAQWAVLVWLGSTVLAGLYTIYGWHFGQSVSWSELAQTDSRFSAVLADDSELDALDVVARATGPTSHSAVYGINLLLAVPMFFFFIKHATSRPLKAALWFGLAITLYNVALTNTRATMLLAALVVVLCGLRGLYRFTPAGIVGVAIAGAAMLPLVPEAVWNRVLDPSNYTLRQSATLRIRLDYWQAGLDVIADHWATGVGVGNQREVPRYLKIIGPEQTTVHNDYIQTAMEVGVVGWLLFYGFVAWMLVVAVRARRRAGDDPAPLVHADFFIAVQIAMLATLAYAVQVDVFHFPLKSWWLLAGLTWAAWRQQVEFDAGPPATQEG
jgi:O-Antigen ligase